MKNIFKKFGCAFLLLLSLVSVTFFFAEKKVVENNEQTSAYYYETDSSYLYNLFHSEETLESNYNLAKHYPLVNENQTESNLCWIYTSMKILESSFMVQTGEYYNFSEVGQAYLDHANSNKIFDYGADFNAFVHSYQDNGLILESDFSNTEYEEIAANNNKLDFYDYINDFATKDYNAMIKPYSICDLSYYIGLSRENQRKVVKSYIKNYGGLFGGLEGSPKIGGSVGCFYVDTNANDPEKIYTFYSDNRTLFQYYPRYYPLTAYHAVTVVGWNDDITFGKETGAFLVMNSWGFESNSYSFFYVPYSYDFIYETFAGFICDSSAEQNVKIQESEQSSFTTDILTGSNEMKNYFCYDDDISVTYKLKVNSFKDAEVRVNSGSRPASDLFNINFSDEDKTATISIRQNLDVFYGGYYTISFFNDGALIGKKSIYIFSGTEIGNFKILYQTSNSWDIDSYALNNTFLNNDTTATINVSGLRQSYRLDFNMATPVYNALVAGNKINDASQRLLTISDISIVSSSQPELETKYSSDELMAEFGESEEETKNALFYKNTISPSANVYRISIGYNLTLDKLKNSMVRFKITISSVLYEDCEREFYFNMFVSERAYAGTEDLNTIVYVLDGGENDPRNINKYPKYSDVDYPDPNMTSVKLLAPSKSGFRFVGWYLDEYFIEEITEIDEVLSEDGHIKLYAKWDKNLIDYFYLTMEKDSLRDYYGNEKLLTDNIIYGDTVGIRFTISENPETSVSGYNYQISYYFYGPELINGNLTKGNNSHVIDIGFPRLKTGGHNFKMKIIVYITQNLVYETEKYIRLEVEKKNISFAFSDLSKVYNGAVQKPSVSLVEDFYDEDKLNLKQSDLFVLKCQQQSKDYGSYEYYISEVFNKNYTYDTVQARCVLFIDKKEINLKWKEYNQVYDGLNHFPEYSVLGVLPGDYVSFGFTQDECRMAGQYTININPDTISNKNYKVSSVSDFTFVIQKAKIKVIMHNATDRTQTKIGRRVEPKYTILGNYYNVDDLDINIISEGKHATSSGKYNISCIIGNNSYDAEIQDATYTLTGFYYVYYQLSNGDTYSERVEEGQTPKGITKEELDVPMFSKIEYSSDFDLTGNDLYVAVELKDYSGVVYSVVFIVGFLLLYLVYYLKKRESKVR